MIQDRKNDLEKKRDNTLKKIKEDWLEKGKVCFLEEFIYKELSDTQKEELFNYIDSYFYNHTWKSLSWKIEKILWDIKF